VRAAEYTVSEIFPANKDNFSSFLRCWQRQKHFLFPRRGHLKIRTSSSYKKIVNLTTSCVVNPHHFDADPDPACHFDGDAYPDPHHTFHFDAVPGPDPNPSFQIKA
jgi:hypothetical protein